MKWLSIIQDEKLKNKILSKLREIADSLCVPDSNHKEGIGLMSGSTGIMLFLFYYSKFSQQQKYYDAGVDMIQNTYEVIGRGFTNHRFSEGLAGVEWAVEHLVTAGMLELEIDDDSDDLGSFFYDKMQEDLQRGYFDWMHGAIGNGFYFLNPAGENRFKKHRDYLGLLVQGLERISSAEETVAGELSGGILWPSVVEHQTGLRGVNLGLAHGTAGIIWFLGKMVDIGVAEEKARFLLEGAVKCLLDRQLEVNPDVAKHLSRFPSKVIPGRVPVSSRLAWCNGDPGIGIALWLAGLWAGNKEWKQCAVDVLLHSCRRRNPEENGVFDAGICHGTAGVAHIFNRMYHYTGIESFKDSARYWIEATVKKAVFDDAPTGFKTMIGAGEQTEWAAVNGLLDGIAGIGLVLTAAVSDIDPGWDRCLLLS